MQSIQRNNGKPIQRSTHEAFTRRPNVVIRMDQNFSSPLLGLTFLTYFNQFLINTIDLTSNVNNIFAEQESLSLSLSHSLSLSL